MLPRNINVKSGYRISANEIRYEAGEEKIAQDSLKIIEKKGIFESEEPIMKDINPPKKTPNYISVFVRNM